MSRILFISTHNLATNPRLVKEIDLALKNNYEVSVLCCEFNNWSKINNEKIKQRLLPAINYRAISGDRTPYLRWLLSSFFFSFSKIFLLLFPSNTFLLSVRSNKRSWLILRGLKKITEKIDLVVAHNPGSFYPVQVFAKNHQIPLSIDLEDYHPGETNNYKQAIYTKILLNFILPQASYITAASPLILEYTKKDISLPLNNAEVVLNYFEQEEFVIPKNNDSEKLQLVWFSQNVAKGRGLEEIIPLIGANRNLELHLYGNMNMEFYNQWIEGIENVYVHEPLPQRALHQELRKYDVGFAIEPGKDLNNDLALSNKILAYYQSGLFILASDTKAQQNFIKEYPNHGIITSLENPELEKVLQKLSDNKNSLRASALQRFENAKSFSWENESEKLVQLWKQILR